MKIGRFARAASWLAVATLPLTTGCVTLAEFRKLERDVRDMERAGGGPAPERRRMADLAAELQSIQGRLAEIEGRMEVAEHRADEALEEARAARADAATPGAPETPAAPAGVPPQAGPAGEPAVSEEVQAYRAAYAAWRSGDSEACVDRFRDFLQTYPSSAYADDGAYWLADCYFKQGDYKTAILRYDDVVSRYPTGDKAADALYRQGEALLRLGPGYGKAAGKAFERVLKEYPDSARAQEAKRQLDLLGSG